MEGFHLGKQTILNIYNSKTKFRDLIKSSPQKVKKKNRTGSKLAAYPRTNAPVPSRKGSASDAPMISRSLSGRTANRFGLGGLNPGGGVIDVVVPLPASLAVHLTTLYRRFGFGLALERTGERDRGPACELSTAAIQWSFLSPVFRTGLTVKRGEWLIVERRCCEISRRFVS